jgi:integrase
MGLKPGRGPFGIPLLPHEDMVDRWRAEEERSADVLATAVAKALRKSPSSREAKTWGKALSVGQYAERWITRRRADRLKNVDDDEAVLRNHVLKKIGDDDMRTIPRARLVTLRDDWNNRSSLTRDHDDFIPWKTARNFWGLVAKMFSDAAHPDSGHADPRDPSSAPLHVRDDDPAAKIRAPIERGERQQCALWPNEADALLTCARVPCHWRVLYAIAFYTGLRQSELRALQVQDVDLENGLLSVAKKVSRRTGKIEATKTKKVGYCPIESNLCDLLAALIEGRDGTEALLWMPPEEDLAANVRDKHLPWAGVTRADLFADDETHQNFTFHGARHSHLTWRAGRGDNATDLMGTVLHSDFLTTQGYIDQAVLHALRRQREKLFGPLPSDLIEAARGGTSPERTRELQRRRGGGSSLGTTGGSFSADGAVGGGRAANATHKVSGSPVQFPLGSRNCE